MQLPPPRVSGACGLPAPLDHAALPTVPCPLYTTAAMYHIFPSVQCISNCAF